MSAELRLDGPTGLPSPKNDCLAFDCAVLETERLVLRTPHIEDAEDIARQANNFNVAGNLGRMPHPYYDADAREYIAKVKASDQRDHVFAITAKDSGAFMGLCGLHPANDIYELPHIGYWLGEDYWGNGYATEAARALVDLYFKVTMEDRMMISALRKNAPSKRVIEKCGGRFWKPGTLFSIAMGQPAPVDHYLVTRENWLSSL